MQSRQQLLHIGAHLHPRPRLRGHMRFTISDQAFRIRVGKLAARVTPFAILLIKGAIRFPAQNSILQRHTTALTNQMPGRPQQRIDGYIIKPGQQLQCFRSGECLSPFPSGYRLTGHKYLFCQFFLRKAISRAQGQKNIFLFNIYWITSFSFTITQVLIY